MILLWDISHKIPGITTPTGVLRAGDILRFGVHNYNVIFCFYYRRTSVTLSSYSRRVLVCMQFTTSFRGRRLALEDNLYTW